MSGLSPEQRERLAEALPDELQPVGAGLRYPASYPDVAGRPTEYGPTEDPHRTLTTTDRYAMITRQNTGGAEMSTSPHEVLRTLTTAGHQSLTEWVGELPDIDDCLFRMLEPHEIKVGMAFARGYVLLGNKRAQVRLAGNAVTPPAARDLIHCVAESLNGAA